MPDAATTPVVSGVDFVSIPTRDLDASMQFYGEVLGLPRTVLREPHNAEYQAGNVTLCVLHSEQMGFEFSANHNHLALHVHDFEAACSMLVERGVTFTRDHLDTGVCHMAFLTDPDGNELMLHHRYAPTDNGATP